MVVAGIETSRRLIRITRPPPPALPELTMYRTPNPFPCRKVVKHEMSTAWWDMLSKNREWFLTLECGHSVIRTRPEAPSWVRCDGCMPR